jgi:hypothetical protein
MTHFHYGLWAEAHLLPNQGLVYFFEPVRPNAVRTFTAVPINDVRSSRGGFTEYDQFIEITEVYYVLKGQVHARDGTGGARDLQVNVAVRNRSPVNPVSFHLMVTEAWL